MAGYGDALIGSGLAKGAAARGKLVAFGNGKRILWSVADHEIFRNNPNVAPPGYEASGNLEWIEHYKGRRVYGTLVGGRWQFRDWSCPPGELFFCRAETEFAHDAAIDGCVVIEPMVKPRGGACDPANKQWPVKRYAALADALQRCGIECVQFWPLGSVIHRLPGVRQVVTPSFRHAAAAMQHAALYIGPEGGLHHAAAALGLRAVVIFGGFNSPKATGYGFHRNIAIGEPCGSINHCPHCIQAMETISTELVLRTALGELPKAAA